jgi:FAD/FMN-containing dehydrogenase/Fe-S oxidoreductase
MRSRINGVVGLKQTIAGEVRFDPGSRALYATDLSIYRQVPVGVVIPRTIDDVVATVQACREHGVPILGRGCGTSLAGQCCNVAVVIDFSKYLNRIVALDAARRTATVQPGVICDALRQATAQHHLTLAPDPATHAYCTLGGMIGNNSCGAHTVMGGKTVDNVEALEILTYDGLRMHVGQTSDDELERIISQGGRRGEIYARLRALRDRYTDLIRERYPHIPRRVSGYNLDALLPENGFHVARALVGTESTCALVLGATVRLLPSPLHRALLIVGYADMCAAGDHVVEVRSHGPIALEAFHVHVIENMRQQKHPPAGARLLPAGTTWLLVEFGGETPAEASDKARAAMQSIQSSDRDCTGMCLLTDASEQKAIWDIREAGVAASRVPGVEEAWPSWEDAAVPPERLGDYLRDFDKLLKRYHYRYTLFGHFGDGCIHCRITFDLKTAAGVQQFRAFMQDAADLVLSYGGSLSGEHGDGQARAELLPKMFGPELIEAFREFKAIWDPQWKMNPGKVVDPYPLDTNLRVGPDYHPRPVLTHFQFPDDQGSLARATERCFGIGKCRRLEGGTMCPSFMVTREEQHTTRGRAHLLFEMLRGDAITAGWRDTAVKESLDLCLACKGCKGDCPAAVDIATYKAEFLAHYYEGRWRPRSAYAMGFIFHWARLASSVPHFANALTQTPWLARWLKAVAGIAPERAMPSLAAQPFTRWFQQRAPKPNTGRRVLLWPDTFNNYFRSETAQAAVAVLEDAGYQVEIPRQALCCGRPLYDYGMLDRAKRQLREILQALAPEIQQGVPIVGLEPSCVAVFRDELGNLFPNDLDAQRLQQQMFLLSEFLARDASFVPAPWPHKALVHGHCHEKAVIGLADELALLRKMGIDAQVLDAGCCGLAGSFGYESQHYDISMRVGERVLLPAVRSAPPDSLIIANGFSCREQIDTHTDRQALHLAEVLHLARQAPAAMPRDQKPIIWSHPASGMYRLTPVEKAIVAGGLVLLSAGVLGYARTRRR